jgi:hypothetical protein
MLKIAITGHRNLLNDKEIRENIALSLQYFQKNNTDLQAISALAVGADTIFAQEAVKLKIPVRYVLPFELKEYEKDFSPSELMVLQDLLAKNKQLYEVTNPLKNDSPEARNEAYLATGKHLVDECDILLAVWDGQPAKGKGGTGDVVAYAREQGKKVEIIEALRPKPKMETTSIFFSDYDLYDKEAMKQKRWFDLYFWKGGIFLGVLAVFIFAVTMSFTKWLPCELKGFWLPIIEVILVFMSFGFLGAFATKSKTTFLQKRHLAEYLRIHDLMSNCGLVIKTDNKQHGKYPIPNKIRDLETKYITNQPDLIDLDSMKTKLIEFIKSQNKYHTDIRIEGYKEKEHSIEEWLNRILWAFSFIVIAKLVFELMEYYHNHFIHEHEYLLAACKFLIILLPPSYAALEGIFYFSEWRRNIEKSKAVNENYNSLEKKINACNDIEALKVLSEDLNHCFWNEQYDWLEWYHNKKIGPKI